MYVQKFSDCAHNNLEYFFRKRRKISSLIDSLNWYLLLEPHTSLSIKTKMIIEKKTPRNEKEITKMCELSPSLPVNYQVEQMNNNAFNKYCAANERMCTVRSVYQMREWQKWKLSRRCAAIWCLVFVWHVCAFNCERHTTANTIPLCISITYTVVQRETWKGILTILTACHNCNWSFVCSS